jgi:F420-non-reducing hydrogenase iron-sulfur subunit
MEQVIDMSEESDFEPNIIGFLCNWCSYAGADLAGVSRFQYPPNVKVIRVMCSSRVDPMFVLKALTEGADGVLIAGCHPGDCHYIEGNYRTRRRIAALEKILEKYGLNDRVFLEWVSASEGNIFAEVITNITNKIKELGPNPHKKTWEI